MALLAFLLFLAGAVILSVAVGSIVTPAMGFLSLGVSLMVLAFFTFLNTFRGKGR